MDKKNAGNLHFLAKEYKEAIDAFSAGINEVEDGDDRTLKTILYSNRSQVWLALESWVNAEADAAKAIELDAHFTKSYLRLAKAQAQQEKFLECVATYEKVFALEPAFDTGDARATLNVAYATLQLSRNAEWRVSDALSEQNELQAELDAPYVFIFTVPTKAEPIRAPAAVLSATAKACMKKAFVTANSGDLYALRELCHLLRDHGHISAQGKMFTPSLAAVQEQLSREFAWDLAKYPLSYLQQQANAGSTTTHANDNLTRQRAHTTSHTEPCRIRPTLFCIENSTKAGRTPFYPAGPWWIEHVDEFAAVLQGEMGREAPPKSMIEIVANNFKQQRLGDDGMHLLEYFYEGRKDELMTPAQHKELYAKAGHKVFKLPQGQRFTQMDVVEGRVTLQYTMIPNFKPSVRVPIKCDCCGVVLELDSPPECACGEHYCSEECHARDWEEHKSSCLMVIEAQKGLLSLSELYWRYVMLGAIAWVGGIPDFSRMWRSLPNKSDKPDEFKFLILKEREAQKERIGVLQELRNQLLRDGKDAQASTMPLVDEVILQHEMYSTPLRGDSPQRLQFKLLMVNILSTILGQIGCDGAVEPLGETIKKYEPLLKNVQPATIPEEAGITFHEEREARPTSGNRQSKKR